MPKPKDTPKKSLSAKYLRICFGYDPETGVIKWKRRPQNHFPDTRAWKIWNTRFAGIPAGNNFRGHLLIVINGYSYGTHRVIWTWMTGKQPPASIDHIDGNPANNRWANLRAATSSQQQWNTGLPKNNTSGFKGVRRHRSKWRVQIWIKGVLHQRGGFDTPEEAAAVYESLARKFHGEFYRQG